mgnify:CR=1 FL=1
MIKKLIGIIVAVAVVVIIVVAAIRRDNFQSMVRRDELLNGVEPAAEPPHLISPAELDVPAEGAAVFRASGRGGPRETVPQISSSRFRAG